jgi:trans-2,3-dihydro-3-hydroxyanthranilate isomerase
MTRPFYWIDAFTAEPLAGNPCAVLLDTEGLDTDRMQRIAREMNLSETAFVTHSTVADFAARYFTPAEEIPLAGHPTLAVTRALLDDGRLRLNGGGVRFSLELRDGPIEVAVRTREDGGVVIVMTQRRPVFLRVWSPGDVAAAFGLRSNDLHPDAAPQTVSTGTPQLMVPVRDIEVLREARLDANTYRALKKRGDFFSPHLFVTSGATSDGDTFARHFGVPPDTAEDPFTGSATGGMAAYLWHHGLIDAPHFVAEQGHDMGRPGRAWVEIDGPREAPERVRVAGQAVTLARGTLDLQAGS